MATLKVLLAGVADVTNLDFVNNAEADSKGNFWANAFVVNRDNALVKIGATVDTLKAIQADPTMSNLVLTKMEAMVAKESGREYLMCQLAVAKPADFSFAV
jgi:hypothetical protein